MKKKRKLRLRFYQWLALKCRKPIVVIIGARRTGKSYTAIKLAKESINNGDSVCILSPTTVLAHNIFLSTITSGIKTLYWVNKQNHMITNCETKAEIKFKAGSELKELFPQNEKLPDILIIDETFDPLRMLMQIDYLQRKRCWKYKKIFMVFTPVKNVPKNVLKKVYGSYIKIYTWRTKYHEKRN